MLIWILALNLKKTGQASHDSLDRRLEALGAGQDRFEKVLKDEMGRGREASSVQERAAREELNRLLFQITQVNEQKLESIRQTLEKQLKTLQEDNGQKLDQMRMVVDEKLQATLEKRLSDSFRQVSERLEKVHQGLGEMQLLASSVGDLKAVLTNVKTRGTWGEVQLESLLSQMLSPDQFSKNVATKKGSDDRVEFAVRLPGRGPGDGDEVWLPIDAKFPLEDYQRLMAAVEAGDSAGSEEHSKNLIHRIKLEAKTIKEKYLDPPHTTDFGILFLPTEGLYAEVLRQPGLSDFLQREHRIVITGPTTLAAILNSLQIGFRTLAIEKRSSEVWSLLGSVKKEFGLFTEVLEKTQKKLQEASNTIEKATVKTRAIERKLRNVEGLPALENAISGEEQQDLPSEEE
ncbi:MAG TPA: DNA recombination protein RmuC [bacterium]|nr:DNA recombination protein RmuC [bacterium]